MAKRSQRWPMNQEQIIHPAQSSLKSEKNEKETWMSSEEAATHLSISQKSLFNLTSSGRLPYYKFGRSNKYLRSELDALLLSQPKGIRQWQ